jgi:hypothetical protein
MAGDGENALHDKELLKEYFEVAEDTAKLSDRRQTVGDIYVGVNSLFLSGMGFVVVSSHLTNWWTAGICGAITLVTTAFNLNWRSLIVRYRNLIRLRIQYLVSLEKLLQRDGGEFSVTIQMAPSGTENQRKGHKEREGKPSASAEPPKRGVYTIEGQSDLYLGGDKVGFFALELRFVYIFMAAYVLVTGAVVALTVLILDGFLPKLSL